MVAGPPMQLLSAHEMHLYCGLKIATPANSVNSSIFEANMLGTSITISKNPEEDVRSLIRSTPLQRLVLVVSITHLLMFVY